MKFLRIEEFKTPMLLNINMSICPFSALMLLVGRQEGHPACKKTEWWGAGVVVCLELGADLHMAQLMPLPLTVSCFSKIQIGLPYWYRLTWVVPEKGPLNGCVCVCVSTDVPLLWGMYTPSNICLLGLTRVCPQNNTCVGQPFLHGSRF